MTMETIIYHFQTSEKLKSCHQVYFKNKGEGLRTWTRSRVSSLSFSIVKIGHIQGSAKSESKEKGKKHPRNFWAWRKTLPVVFQIPDRSRWSNLLCVLGLWAGAQKRWEHKRGGVRAEPLRKLTAAEEQWILSLTTLHAIKTQECTRVHTHRHTQKEWQWMNMNLVQQYITNPER